MMWSRRELVRISGFCGVCLTLYIIHFTLSGVSIFYEDSVDCFKFILKVLGEHRTWDRLVKDLKNTGTCLLKASII